MPGSAGIPAGVSLAQALVSSDLSTRSTRPLGKHPIPGAHAVRRKWVINNVTQSAQTLPASVGSRGVGGRVGLESQLAQGTRFWIELPSEESSSHDEITDPFTLR